jgi:hypothetical protein
LAVVSTVQVEEKSEAEVSPNWALHGAARWLHGCEAVGPFALAWIPRKPMLYNHLPPSNLVLQVTKETRHAQKYLSFVVSIIGD